MGGLSVDGGGAGGDVQAASHTHPLVPHARIFGFEGADAEDVIYVNWLNMVRAGLLALEFYTPEATSWRQVGARGPLRREAPAVGTKIRIPGVGMGQPYLRGTRTGLIPHSTASKGQSRHCRESPCPCL